jgi:hypothetical protein
MLKIIQQKLGHEVGLYGDFEIRKAYDLNSKKANGIIIQYVDRKTCATYDNKKLTTTKQIVKFTDEYVMYSNDSYYEYFEVVDGESINADSFASGAIAKYDKKGNVIISDKTVEGITTIKAESFFISNKSPLYESIINKPWDNNLALPSNGLPYLPKTYKKTMDKYKENADSNIVFHNVIVKWSDKTNGKSKIKSKFT